MAVSYKDGHIPIYNSQQATLNLNYSCTNNGLSQDLLYSTGSLLNIMWQPGWKGVWEGMDISICMAKSLYLKLLQHCPNRHIL